jgi:hypothetical protein
MKKALLVLVAAGSLAGATIAVPGTANAQRGFAAGLVGGLIGGAIVGGAIASSPPPGYYGPAPGCYWGRGEPYWDGYRWVRPRVQICP